jgi:hypothetical protein
VWLVLSSIISPLIEEWREKITAAYLTEGIQKQRCRMSITYDTITKIGSILMKIEKGILIFPLREE